MMPRRRAVDNPPPTYPEGWQGGPDDFGILGTFNGHVSIARHRTDPMGDGEYEDRRNACYEQEDA
jgi:hypothetical protein